MRYLNIMLTFHFIAVVLSSCNTTSHLIPYDDTTNNNIFGLNVR